MTFFHAAAQKRDRLPAVSLFVYIIPDFSLLAAMAAFSRRAG